jgi:DNA primase
MSMIPDELIEQVRDAADLIQLIGEHVELKRTGADYRGPCPFHGGAHRNFAVIPKKGMFYCFVCHAAGDVFSFYMKKLGMDYPTAVRSVAGRVGITIPERAESGPDPREPLFSAVAAAGEWYARQLRENPEAEPARKYLAGRGVDVETAAPHALGFAPPGRAFLDAMKTLGLAEPVLLEAGLLVKRDDGSLVPRFRRRLLFPIHDLRGRVVGFGGRALGDEEPKYLNSPDTPLFHKGKLLYNLHQAKHAIRREGGAIVVEGYFDVLRLLLAGIEHVVAPLGTGLTEEQAGLLKRFAPHVTLLYDSDGPGLRAAFRAGDVLLRQSLRVTVATLPEGDDPDTLVQRGGREALEPVLRDAVDVFERKIQILERKGWTASVEKKREALDRLLPTIRAAADPVMRDLYLGRAAESLGISAGSIRHELDRGREPGDGSRQTRPDPAHGSRLPASIAGPDWTLIRVLAHEPDWRGRLKEMFTDRTPDHPETRAILTAVAALRHDQPASDALPDLAPDASALLQRALAVPLEPVDVDATVAGVARQYDLRDLEREMHDIDRRIPVASESEKTALVRKKVELQKRAQKVSWWQRATS